MTLHRPRSTGTPCRNCERHGTPCTAPPSVDGPPSSRFRSRRGSGGTTLSVPKRGGMDISTREDCGIPCNRPRRGARGCAFSGCRGYGTGNRARRWGGRAGSTPSHGTPRTASRHRGRVPRICPRPAPPLFCSPCQPRPVFLRRGEAPRRRRRSGPGTGSSPRIHKEEREAESARCPIEEPSRSVRLSLFR